MTNSTPRFNSLKSTATAAMAFFITAIVPISGHAEDIEIYEGLTGEVTDSSVTSEQKPNILFVLDTSGSMGRPEVVLGARPEYDSATDYGTSGPNDNVYIYDDNRNYTGMFVSNANNNCKAAADFHTDNPDFPEYVDRALVWEYFAPGSEEITTCTNDEIQTINDNENVAESWNQVALVDVTEGDEINISIEVQSYGYVAYYFWNGGNQRIDSTNYCYQFIDDFENLDCGNVTVPVNAAKVRVLYYGIDEFFGDNVTTRVTTPGSCTTITQVIAGSGNWELDADDGAEILALECEADNGVHGSSDASAAVYPQYQEDTNGVDQPNYVGAAGNPFAVDWNASSLEERLIVPGNYHDYLQTPVADLLGTGTTTTSISGSTYQDVVDYCVEEGDIITLGDSGTRTYVNAGHFVEHDGFIYECQSRIAALKAATTNIISSMSGTNVGIMRFNTSDGGSLISAVVDVDGSVSSTDPTTGDEIITTNKSKILEKVLELPGAGATPLQETLYEAYLYFAGETPGSAGASKNMAPDGSTVDLPITGVYGTTDDITDADALVDGKYKSPILNQCQDNNIILFSDGAATSDVGRHSEIQSVSGKTCSDSTNGDCLDELAYALANTDVNADVKLENNVYLHTIGFGGDLDGSTQLLDASNQALRPGAEDDSQHYEATNTDQLISAFQSILLSIDNVEADSFIAPAVAVNAFNRLQFRNELYFALFEPKNNPRWTGNIKKYKITSAGTIVDANQVVAVDDSGFFHENAQSYWSDIVDGNDVSKGGAARELDLNLPRKIFANLDSDSTTIERLLDKEDFVQKVLLSDTSDVTNLGQNGINLAVIDLISSFVDVEGILSANENLNNIIEFTFGYDVDQELEGAATDANFYLGESLHGTPYVLDYGSSVITGTRTPLKDEDGEFILTPSGDFVYEIEQEEASTSNDILYYTTNQGLLHAVDGDTGEELWAYIPDPDLFENLGDYYNQTIDDDHSYGLDGQIEFVVERSIVDLTSTEDDVSKVITTEGQRVLSEAKMYFGQRRGGSKYFALDVLAGDVAITDPVEPDPTDPTAEVTLSDNPVTKMWTLEGLLKMGQSWAKPVATKIKYCDASDVCGARDVLVISGGYDLKYDDYDPTAIGGDTFLDDIAGTVNGNVIYIVDRASGALLWTAGPSAAQVNTDTGYSLFPDMQHSFVSEPTVIDADFDGIADLMFAVDIAGRIWRFDFRGHVYTNQDDEVVIDDSDIHAGNNGTMTDGSALFSSDGSDLNEVSGGIIADLTEAGANRLFYNKLDVSLVDRTKYDEARYTIVTGSGYRAHPLLDEGGDDVDFRNRIYFVFDRHLQFPKAIDSANDDDGLPNGITYNYVEEVENDGSVSLSQVDATVLSAKDNSVALQTVVVSEVSGEEVVSHGAHRHGFYINLTSSSKEKMINPTITNDGKIFAVSYSPTAVVTNAGGDICEKNIGSSALYQIDLLTGRAARLDLAKAGISTKPLVIEVDNDDDPDNNSGTVKVLIIGSESFGGSEEGAVNEGDEIDELIHPEFNKTKIGEVNKINWWERRN